MRATISPSHERAASAEPVKHYHPDPDHTPDGYRDVDEPVAHITENPLWQRENVVLMSIGIDIGSAGTQVLFSQVHLARQSVDLSTRYLIVDRETLFESPVSLTPYAGEHLIDARALGGIVDAAFADARLHPNQIDTGVVLLTGEALRRENAEPIAHVLSEKCGELVCASAGHHMEAMLAAHGSGAVRLSSQRQLRLLNIDIGGGTTKLSVLDCGRIVATAALHIGSRLIAFDDDGVIERLEPAGREHAQRVGLDVSRGTRLDESQRAAVAAGMADALVDALSVQPSQSALALYLTDPIGSVADIDAVLCSGGVAEYVYEREAREFGDLGKALGAALRARLDAGDLPGELLTESRGIRATALGCAEFTAQLSGNTSYIGAAERTLPRRDLTVVRPPLACSDALDASAVSNAITEHLRTRDIDVTEPALVLAFHYESTPRYENLRSFAAGIADALAQRAANGSPIYIILDADIAMSLGNLLHDEFVPDCDLVVLDGLELWDFDSVDIGAVREPSMTVPVTIKSLVFSDVDDGVRPRELVGRRGRQHPEEATL
jgi:ethanolamine utilization protein EutA